MDRGLAEEVRRRADYRCEYCQFPAARSLVPFQIDHVLAEKHGGQPEFPNLALACFYCNNYNASSLLRDRCGRGIGEWWVCGALIVDHLARAVSLRGLFPGERPRSACL
jgi:hypothetical protein